MKKLRIALAVFFLCSTMAPAHGSEINCWFAPDWKLKTKEAHAITMVLSAKSGQTIKPSIARSYLEILTAFSTDEPNMVFVGSFVQAVVAARGLGTPVAQAVNGKEMYGSWMIYPKGGDPQAILANSPEKIAFAKGASSGESGAKAATDGKASIATPDHGASANAVTSGKAAAAFVKNWWWEANKDKYPGLAVYQVPGISDLGNPDNVLTVSKAVSGEVTAKIKGAAMEAASVFGAEKVVPFSSDLGFSIGLMKKGKIDPMTYTW